MMTTKAQYDASESILEAMSGYHSGDSTQMMPEMQDRTGQDRIGQDRIRIEWSGIAWSQRKQKITAREADHDQSVSL